MGTSDASTNAQHRFGLSPYRLYRSAFLVVLVLLLGLNAVSLAVYWQDSQRLAAVAEGLVDRQAPASEKARALAGFVSDLPTGSPDGYHLLPIFRPLRLTAAQVLDLGGECAHKGRAFIVLLHHLDVEAQKLVLRNAAGEPRHAVVVVETEQGDLVVDLLYGIVYEHEDGEPMSLGYLADHLPGVIEQEIRWGNTLAADYPLEDYPFTDPVTINWQKNALWQSARRALGWVLSEQQVDRLGRPFLAEEPALMVLVASGFFLLVLWTPLGLVKIYQCSRSAAREDAS
ncbi:MAG: hypothetical protein SX243_04570 [Acidobacteriota bacterium]|nr:hypothetical protein [Acidobacteriota bacterium]